MNSALAAILIFLFFIIGCAVGALVAYLYLKAQTSTLEADHKAALKTIDWIRDAQHALRETFEVLAAKSLRDNATDFSGRVQGHLVSHATQINTLKVGLETNIHKIDQDIRDLECKREGAYVALTQNVTNLQKAYIELKDTTSSLLNALKSGPVRGRWGEIQLRKIVELSGMTPHVSFDVQVAGESGTPDMVVQLPNQGQIAVDSKFTAQAFLEGMASTDEAFRSRKLQDHARDLRRTIQDLSKRAYWAQFDPSPELVIMFVPIESSLMAAFDVDPEIIDFALSQKVILASPITLLAFMKSIHFGWQQFAIRKNAKLIVKQAKELHDRADTWMGFFRDAGKKLGGLVESYNKCVASLQARFFPSCRKFEELSAIADELDEPDTVTKGPHLAPRSQTVSDGQGHANPTPADKCHREQSGTGKAPENGLPLFAPEVSEPESEPFLARSCALSLVVIWDSVNSSPGTVAVVRDGRLWRSVFDLGLRIYRHEKEQKDAHGKLILDAKGFRPFVETAGLPLMLLMDQHTGRVVRHFPMPDKSDEVLPLVRAAIGDASQKSM
jgi:DNA recombination protein RmuC